MTVWLLSSTLERPLRNSSSLPSTPLVSRWGWAGMVASQRGVRLLVLPVPTAHDALARVQQHYPDVPTDCDHPFLLEAREQILAYFSGQLLEFSVEVDLRGHTPFALSVWAITRRVKYGHTCTYGWIADQLGGAKAAQAVGAALGANPVPLIIPCHRVVGADGSLHGFAGGLSMKARLLAMESGQAALL
jgi:methylated-DNA-[protein]-cysteine S-methyltransferase